LTKISERQWQRIVSCDKPCATVVGEVVPRPLNKHEQSILEFHEVDQMDKKPDEPSDETREMYPSEICYCYM